MATKSGKKPFTGYWHIEWMEQWGRDFIDADVRGYFEFDKKDSGSFQFGYVAGQIDYRIGVRDGKPCVEFSWDGNDEMEPAQGRGWLVLEGDALRGMFYIHLGDESGIVLKRAKTTKRPRKK
jgi:hypothetical protein